MQFNSNFPVEENLCSSLRVLLKSGKYFCTKLTRIFLSYSIFSELRIFSILSKNNEAIFGRSFIGIVKSKTEHLECRGGKILFL